MSQRAVRVHVLYEAPSGEMPNACGYIRLLRPLAHYSISERVSLTHGASLPAHSVDVVIVQRFWNHVCDWTVDHELFSSLRRRGVKIIYEIDDDLLDCDWLVGGPEWPDDKKKMWLRQMVRFADAVTVSTQSLAERLSTLNDAIFVIENALDDTLLPLQNMVSHNDSGKVMFGYFGTLTHLDDLLSVIGPIRHVLAENKDFVSFQIIGVGEESVLRDAFNGLPVSFVSIPNSVLVDYRNFHYFFSDVVAWDFGIAPLINSRFNNCKSDIKFLDYAAHEIPGVFSDVRAYSSTVVDGLNGLMAQSYDGWLASLRQMIADASLRSRLAKEASSYLKRNRTCESISQKWLTVLGCP